MAGWQDSWVFVVVLGRRVGKAEKQGLKLQSTCPPASPTLGGNLQGPSGFEGRGQEDTLNSGSADDRNGGDRALYPISPSILFLCSPLP